MRKGDKGKMVLGVIMILAIIVSVFGGAVSAEDVSIPAVPQLPNNQ